MRGISLSAGLVLAVLAMFSGLLALAGPAMADARTGLNLNLTWGTYPAGGQVMGDIIFIHDAFIPSETYINAYIDNNLVSSVQADGLLPDISEYSFPAYTFSYDLTTSGTNDWREYPDEVFDYSVMVSGTCGDGRNVSEGGCCYLDSIPPVCFCNCQEGESVFCGDQNDPSSYPCEWQTGYYQGWGQDAVVRGSEGLKFIDDFSNEIGLPGDRHEASMLWWEDTNTDPAYPDYNPNVITTMREACGGSLYEGWGVSKEGWVRNRPLDPGTWEMDGVHRNSIIEAFDHSSLLFNRGLYVEDNIGGIFKDGMYLSYSQTPAPDSAFWNGTGGEIKIFYYNDQATYSITYLPPNGPRLCAYTNTYTGDSEEWVERQGPFENVRTYYNSPFTRQHGILDFPLAGQPKDCPTGTGDCQQGPVELGADVNTDPSGTVSLDFNEDTMTLTATTSSRMMTRNHTETVGLENFQGISAVSDVYHTLRVELNLFGEILAMAQANFGICDDADADGYCDVEEGGGDCDDSDPNVNPGKTEACNGIDDDCDGVADEGFFVDGIEMGAICGGAPGMACLGTWRCSQDGSESVCFREHEPGELLEICGNGIDDDCDGELDETMTITGDPACWCEAGKRESCGSNIGICKQGSRLCSLNAEGYPQWSICRDSVAPQVEVCNRLDDDCDGMVDDVNGGRSAAEAKCGCYGGLYPMPETCNEIDDNCDGRIDDGVSCCNEGDTRSCGISVGICQEGTQTCVAGSWHSNECEGEVRPKAEICYNNLDDDCDGTVDDGCDTSYTCSNGIQDLNENGIDCGDVCPRKCMAGPIWMIIAGIVIIALLGLWFLIMKQKE